MRAFFDARQAGRGDLPRAVDADRGRTASTGRRMTSWPSLADRPAERRRRLGGRGGGGGRQPGHQPQARRHPAFNREMIGCSVARLARTARAKPPNRSAGPHPRVAALPADFAFASAPQRRHVAAITTSRAASAGDEGVGKNAASAGDRSVGVCRGSASRSGGGDGRASSGPARARSASSPGPATSSAARPTRPTTGSPGSRAQTGCKVNVKTAGTSDEMVALMNEGGFDLVTASGDASLRLIAGKQVQQIDTALIPSWSTVDPRLQDGTLAHRRRQALRRALPVGPERADVQHQGLQGSRRPPGTSCSRSRTCPTASPTRAACRPIDGPIYIADAALYLMAHKPELGIKDPYELTEEQYQAVLDAAARSSTARPALLARRR